ncbi:MAG: 4'-phosphopantetheinyl transferase superfamily protein [Bacteroidales bacterium]|nr:4'-phosphopantetheinyl transferase superfamily protein [Bacteroidales bacterium]
MTELPDYIVWRINESEEELLSGLEHPEFFADKIRNLKPGSRRRLEVLAVRRALKVLFEGEEVPVLYSEEGAPYLSGNRHKDLPCYLSISHTQGYAMAIRCEMPVGCDIERLGTRVQRVVPKFLRNEEIARLQLADDLYDIALHLAWCAKETAFKILGAAFYDLQNLTSVLHIDWNSHLLALGVHGREKPLMVHFDVQDEYVMTWASSN